MLLKCSKPKCKRKWPYHGKKKFPAYTTCPDCKRPVKIIKYVEPNTKRD